MKRRCFICTFWEKRGIVRDYFSYYIKALAEISEKVIVVVNGDINDEGKETLLRIQNTGVLKRENFGLDFGAYKTGIEYIGYEELKDFDELILTNCTCYGPVYPLEDMFAKMENTGCDFWGITKNNGGMWEKTEYHAHIQSYFICINNKMLSSPSFKKYWNDLILYDNYQEEVLEHETKFTEYFEKLGFKSDSFIDFNFIKEMKHDPFLYPEMLLEKYKLPLIKRKSFIYDYEYTKVHRFSSSMPNILLDYLVKNTDYDINMIYNDIIAVHPMSKIQDFFNQFYILPSKYSTNKNSNKKTALILYIYYEDLIDYCLEYAKSLPSGGKADIYIVSSKQNVLDLCREKSKLMTEYNFIFRLKVNRGRDVSAYLVTCRDVFENYDLICCMHDKKTPSSLDGKIFGMQFQNHCFENNLASKEYVQNIISLFESNKFLGMLCPPPSVHTFRDKLGKNLEGLKKLYKMLDFKIPFDYSPNAPFGSMFWIRKEAIKPLFRKDWKYEDFPEEPLADDGTISHAIERIYPAVAQEAGFLSAAVMPDSYARILITNSLYINKHDNYRIIKENIPLFQNMKKFEKIFSFKNAYINDKKYKQICILGIKILKPVTSNNKFLENIFSVKNDEGRKHKVITLLGVKSKIKCKKESVL